MVISEGHLCGRDAPVVVHSATVEFCPAAGTRRRNWCLFPIVRAKPLQVAITDCTHNSGSILSLEISDTGWTYCPLRTQKSFSLADPVLPAICTPRSDLCIVTTIVFQRNLFNMLSWVLNCSLVNSSYYPEQINSIAGTITIIPCFPFPRKTTSEIDSSAVLQLPIAAFDCTVLPSVTIRIKLLSLVQFSDSLLLGRCSVMPSDSQLWYFTSNGIISGWNCYLSWERYIHKAGRRQIIYIFPYLLRSAS